MGMFKLGLFSALIYGAINVLIFFALIGIGQFMGTIGIVRAPLRVGIFLGLMWLISYWLAWRWLRL
jgi:hypothetical protein